MATLRAGLLALGAACALALAGCVAEPVTPSSTPATSSPSASDAPSPSTAPPEYAAPTTDAAGQVALAVLDATGATPESSSITGPGAVEADGALTVEGACEGDEVLRYEIRSTNPDDAGRMLLAGAIECGLAPVSTGAGLGPYAGTVQIVLVGVDGVPRGWVRVVQA